MESKEYLETAPSQDFLKLRVDWRVGIKEFIEDMCRLPFKPGQCFYQFTKTELIRENTKVLLREKRTGDVFTGQAARRLVGLGPGERARVRPVETTLYDIFVQSCSLNRKLVGGTQVLYEKQKAPSI